MAIDMYGNYTPDANPFISPPSNALTGFVPPLDTGAMDATMTSLFPQQQSGGFLSTLGGMVPSLLQAGGSYYAGKEGIKAAQQAGQMGYDLTQGLGQRAFEQSQFKPFGVTSNLANISTTAEGGVDLNLSQPQQRLQNQLLSGAQAAASTLGGAYDPRAGQIGAQAYGQAQQQLGQVGALDPSIAAQRGAVGGLFGQTLGQMGQPTGFEGITQAGLGGAQAQLGRAGQPVDINQLRGQFAGQVGGMLAQTPSAQIGQLGQQALGLGSQGLAGLEAPSDIESLRSQYAGLAGAAGRGLLTSPEQRQADIYESIRATQTPEEERQRLALEERMLSQGRLGLSSAAYGGASPELLAQETARQEAMARANVGARQQALAEQQQALAGATGLLSAGYQPQREALSLLQTSAVPAGFADIGRRTGTELQSQVGRVGLETGLNYENLANQLRLAQQQQLLGGLLGQQPTYAEQLQAGKLGIDLGEAAGLFGSLFDKFGG